MLFFLEKAFYSNAISNNNTLLDVLSVGYYMKKDRMAYFGYDIKLWVKCKRDKLLSRRHVEIDDFVLHYLENKKNDNKCCKLYEPWPTWFDAYAFLRTSILTYICSYYGHRKNVNPVIQGQNKQIFWNKWLRNVCLIVNSQHKDIL